ncbi:MAG TPA: hypothetical protein VH540_20530 [Ktedonobacterales bacterium]|jgi:hypothetical protein
MRHPFWAQIGTALAAILSVLVLAFALTLSGMNLAPALAVAGLLTAILCLALSFLRPAGTWAVSGFLALGVMVTAGLVVRGLANWWWPLGPVLLGIAYIPLAETLPPRVPASWRGALRVSALLLTGIGATWGLGQFLTAALFTSEGLPLLAEDSATLEASFLVCSCLLIVGVLFWAALRQTLEGLAVLLPLVAQVGLALVAPALLSADPGAPELLGLMLIAVALASHACTYFFRLSRPELARPSSPYIWQMVGWRRRPRINEAVLDQRQGHHAWWLCLWLDLGALLLAVIAPLPLGALSTASGPFTGSSLIILSAGLLLTAILAYWHRFSWLALLASFFLAAGLLTLGALSSDPHLFWPLAYLLATWLWLGLALWFAQRLGRDWAIAALLGALGQAALALLAAFRQHNLAWESIVLVALAASFLALLTFWRRGKAVAPQQP